MEEKYERISLKLTKINAKILKLKTINKDKEQSIKKHKLILSLNVKDKFFPISFKYLLWAN
jgi:hypothetical protein